MAKICVTIGRGRHMAMLQEWESAAAAGIEVVELRLDTLRRDPDLKRLLKDRHTPVVITIRRAVDGGLWRGSEEKRQLLLREAIASGVDFVDLEAEIAGSIPRFGRTRRIVSLHNFKEVPDDLPAIAKAMATKDADVVKIAAMANSVPDAVRLIDLMRSAPVPTVGIAMGSTGVFTRILGAKFGAPFTFAAWNPERVFAPGMLTFRDLRDDYLYERIDADTEVYAVIGDPIAHSLSPAVHNPSFRAAQLNKVLVPIHIPAGRVREALEALAPVNLRGVSVTIPHKQDVIPLLSASDKAVELTGACNTMVRDEQGRWVGHNTDYRAAIDTLERALGGTPTGGTSPLMDRRVLMLGAGGVARAIAFGLSRRGAVVTITNRTPERAQKLAEEVGCRAIPWETRASVPCNILINCTSVGMHPDVDSSPMPAAGFHEDQVVFDTVYHPENTLFLKMAREHAARVVTGVDMFVRQAALQYDYYTGGQPAPTDRMRAIVKRKLSPVRV